MILPDVNLLVYACVDAGWQHAAARAWWQAALNGEETVGLCSPALFGFIRLTTSRRIFTAPLPVAKSVALVEAWLSRPQVELIHPGPRHLEIAFGLLRGAGTAGDLTTEVQLAALAIEHQAQLHSNDGDFGRFPGLRWVDPLASGARRR